MARETRDIAYPIAFIGFIFLVLLHVITHGSYNIRSCFLLYVDREYRHNQVNNDRDFDCSDY